MRATPWLLLPALLAGGCAGRPVSPTGALVASAPAGPCGSPGVLVRRPPRATGQLDGEQVGLEVARRARLLEACHVAVGGEAAGRGVVYLLLDVDGEGEVWRVTVGHADVRGRAFERCLEATLRAVPMPATGQSSLVAAHLIFGATGEGEARQMLASYRARRRVEEPDRGAHPLSLAELRGRIRPCYESALRRSPGLSGRTVLHLSLDDEGHVEDASFSSTGDGLGDGLGRCVLGAVRDLRLDRAETSVATLAYPVIVAPGAF